MANSYLLQCRSGVCAALFVGAAISASPAAAQIALSPSPTNINGNVVCMNGDVTGTLGISDSHEECGITNFGEGGEVETITFLSGSSLVTNSGATATFGGAVNFNSNNVQFNSASVAFGGGSATFNNTVSFTGPSVTFSTATTFQNPATFNGTTNFTAGMTTTNITNSGGITTGTLTASTGLTVSAGANISMGGNQIHNVAAGTAATDAVNVAQLNAATAGITADVTALETLTATHTTQIAAIETVNATQSTQISAIQAVNTTQATQISALQAADVAANTRISALEAAQSSLSERVDNLFDLRDIDRRDMKQGIATAIAIAPAPMPSTPGKVAYAVNGASFRGEYAIGGSLTYRLPGDTPFAVNAGFSYAGNKNNGIRLGVAGEF